MDGTKRMNTGETDDEKYKSFFDVGGNEGSEDDPEDNEVRDKIRENKLKSLKERRRSGNLGNSGPGQAHRRR